MNCWGLPLACFGVLLANQATSALAQPVANLGDDGMPGVIRTDSAQKFAQGASVLAVSGYGFSGSDLEQNDSHHRGSGRLALSYAPREDFAFALRLDGRYDKHFGDEGRDDGWVGDPRLIARYRRQLAPSLEAAMQLGIWAPGSEAPSVVIGALSAESVAALSYAPAAAPVRVSFNAGYRLDRSAASVEEGVNLSLADRLSLGVSDYNAVLAAVGASYQLGSLELLGEWSLDFLHGSGAPAFRQSPMRVAAGARYLLNEQLSVVALAEARVSQVQSSHVETMLLPYDPRSQVMVGLNWHLDTRPARPPTVLVADEVVEEPEPPPTTTFGGSVISGSQPVAGATVALTGPDGNVITVQSDEAGRFLFEALPLGQARVLVSAEGYEEAGREIALGDTPSDVEIPLEVVLPPGQLRGVIRSFRGKALEAELTIMPVDQSITTAEDGSFEIDLPPGDYEVTVTVPGFSSQTRAVRIDEDGVTIMNVDLRK